MVVVVSLSPGWKPVLMGLLTTALLFPQAVSVRGADRPPVPPLRSVETPQKVVALSFDDGPSPAATPLILEYLKSQGVHATFFLIGREAAAFPNLVAREAAEGHDVGTHGMHHKPLRASMPQAAMEEELRGATEAIVRAGAPRPTFYRPPEGVISPLGLKVVQGMGYRAIGWSVDPRDAFRRPSSSIVQDILQDVKPGSIILLHDAPGERQVTLDALKAVIPQLKAQGYRIVSVSELLRLTPKNA